MNNILIAYVSVRSECVSVATCNYQATFFFCDFWRMWSVADECPFYPFIVKITLSNHNFEVWANSGVLKRMDTVVLFIDVCN